MDGASWYYLWVNDSTVTPIKTWYTAEAAGCDGGSGVCTVTPTITSSATLPGGSERGTLQEAVRGVRDFRFDKLIWYQTVGAWSVVNNRPCA